MSATASGNRFPDFLIIGAQKAGTTSLHRLLDSAPGIYLPRPPISQEIHFFDDPSNFRRGPQWYAELFLGAGSDEVVGQTSPMYLYDPDVPQRIHDLMPQTKLIAILREPVSRAYSHYWHSVRYGFESKSFDEALRAEPKRLRSSSWSTRRNFSYVDRGLYASQIRRYLELFDRDQLLIVTQDELKESADALFERCREFLSVSNGSGTGEPASNEGDGSRASAGPPEIANRFKQPRSLRLQRLRPALHKLRPLPASGVLDRINLTDGHYDPISDDVRRRLAEGYLADLDELQQVAPDLERTIANWQASYSA